ncbi:MAG: gliding motility lipoprotein GldH [Flavipsychrobacter sp.]
MQSKHIILSLLVTILLLSGCLPSPYYQKEYNVPNNAWDYDFDPSFKFEITDTTAPYHLYFIIRHTDAYPYSNIWVWINTKQPNDTTFQRSRIEIPLTDHSGKWFGRGMGEIWEQRMPITRNDKPMIFNQIGTYEIQFEQNMRINPLSEILNIGLRVEKDTKRNFSTQ